MCAGSAQVTFVELRGSYYTGCKPAEANKNPNANTTPKHKTTEGGSNRLRNSCGYDSRMRTGETGAINSALLSVHLVHQQAASNLLRLCLSLGSWHLQKISRISETSRIETEGKSKPSFTGGRRGQIVDKLRTCNALAMCIGGASLSCEYSQHRVPGGQMACGVPCSIAWGSKFGICGVQGRPLHLLSASPKCRRQTGQRGNHHAAAG